MKKNSGFYILVFAYCFIASFTSCKKIVIPFVLTGDAHDIKGNQAMIGGSIFSGEDITETGICWSTSAEPAIDGDHVSSGFVSESFSCEAVHLTPYTEYHARAYAINKAGIGYGEDKTFTTVAPALGEQYKGGMVYYLLKSGDPGYDPMILHGLIAAPSNIATEMPWTNAVNVSTNATGTAIGKGKVNTNAIVLKLGAGNYAAKACSDLTIDGFSDWFLPSKVELEKLYDARDDIKNLNGGYYWSSSESSSATAITIWFVPGALYNTDKEYTRSTRPIQEF